MEDTLKNLNSNLVLHTSGTELRCIMLINIRGLSCNHCRNAARQAFLAIPGVKSMDIDSATGYAAIAATRPEIAFPKIEAALNAVGFSCTLNRISTPENSPRNKRD